MGKYKLTWKDLTWNDFKIYLFGLFKAFIPKEVEPFIVGEDEEIWKLNFPMSEFPTKLKSQNLEKNPEISGVLKGIKGQYLYFNQGDEVFNLRNSEGYRVSLEVS